MEPSIGHAARGAYYVFPLVVAFVAGSVSKLSSKGNHGPWVWAVPALYLASNLVFWESSSVLLSHTWGTALDHFFAGNPPYYPEQDVTVPFYTAVAYSLGVELKSRNGWL